MLSAAILAGCRSGSSASSGGGACDNSFTCRLTSVVYGAGLFVAVGSGGPTRGDNGNPWIEVSTDGIDWTPEPVQYTDQQLNEAYVLQSVTYGSNGFVTTDGVHVLHSSDGLNWNIESFASPSKKISYVIYDGTRYVMYSNTGGQGVRVVNGEFTNDSFPWKVSTDGVDWTDYGTVTATSGPPGEPLYIIHVAGMYEALWQTAASVNPTRSLTATSLDGLSWTVGNPAPTPMYSILHSGDQYFLFGGVDQTDGGIGSWGVALHGSSLSAMKVVGPLNAPQNGTYPDGEFYPAGEPLHGDTYEPQGLVSNGRVTLGLGEGGLFVTTDGSTWKHESLERVVPETGCSFAYPGTPTCTAFASGAAAPDGSIVVLVARGSAGAETTDGIHWVKSNL